MSDQEVKNEKFLTRVCREILSEFEGNMENLTVVFPSRRAGLFFRKEICDTVGKAFLLPEILTIEDFIFRASGKAKAENTDMLFVLYESYLEIYGREEKNIDGFVGIGRVILKDFSEIDDYLIHPGKLLNVLAEYYRVEQFDLELSGNLQKEYQSFFDLLPGLYYNFSEKLEKQQIANKAKAARILAEHPGIIDRYCLKRQFVFAGFNALTPAESSVINHLYQSGKARLFWDSDAFYLDNKNHEAGYFLRQHRHRWKDTFKEIPAGIGNHLAHFDIIGAPKQLSQVQAAIDLMQDIIGTEEAASTAVILCDEALMPVFFQCMDSQMRANVNFSMGFPATHTIFGQFFRQWLDLKINPIMELNRLDQTPRDQLSKLLNNPLVAEFIGKKTTAAKLPYLAAEIAAGPMYIPSGLWEKALGNPENEFEKALAELHSLSGNFFRYGSSSEEIIAQGEEFCRKLIENTGNFENDLEYLKTESAFMTLQALARTRFFIQSHHLEKELSPATLKNLLGGELKAAKIPLKGIPLKGIQVIGMLESRNLDFENIILVGANEGFLPESVSMQTLIPFDLRRFTEAQLPTWIESESIASYYYYRLLHHARKITLIYNTLPDEFAGKEPSRFIHQLNYELKPALGEKISISNRFIDFGIEKNAETEVKRLSFKPDAGKHRLDFLRENGFSFSNFDLFLSCPYRFYLSVVLRIRQSDSLSSELQSNEAGTLLHLFLEKVFSPFINHEISQTELEGIIKNAGEKEFPVFMQELIRDATEKHFNDGNPDREYASWQHIARLDLDRGMNYLSMNILQKGIKRHLHYILNEIKSGKKFSIHAIEEKINTLLPIGDHPGLKENNKIRMLAVIDRIETMGNATCIIDLKNKKMNDKSLDFVSEVIVKKAAKKTNPAVAESGNLFRLNTSREIRQLLYYLFVYNSLHEEKGLNEYFPPINQAGIYFMMSDKESHHPLLNDKENGDFNFAKFKQLTRESLVEIFREIFSPSQTFEPQPSTNNCRYCEFRNILCHA